MTCDLKPLPIGPRTEQAYFACLRQLSEFHGKSPDLDKVGWLNRDRVDEQHPGFIG